MAHPDDERKKSTSAPPPRDGLSIFTRMLRQNGERAILSWAFGLMILAAAVNALARTNALGADHARSSSASRLIAMVAIDKAPMTR